MDVVLEERTTQLLATSLSTARSAFENGDYRRAIQTIESLPLAVRDDQPVAKLARDCYLRIGEISLALGEVSRMRRRKDSAGLRRQARFMLGRLRETQTSWLPPVPGSLTPQPARENVILHLLKESLPYSQSGYTFRSRMTLEAQRRAGFKPVVATSLGFPTYTGVEEAPLIQDVDHIRHHRLLAHKDLSRQVKTLPHDVLLAEQAAQTAEVVAQERPAVIQAGSGFRGYDQALIGLALARHLDLPLIYEVRGFLEGTWSSRPDLQEWGEYYRLRRAQDERCMREASLVITIAESMHDELVRRGIDAAKIHVVPNAVDVERYRPRPRNAGLTRRLGLEDRFVVGYVSNLGWREGLENLIRATARLIAQHREIACLVVGDGPQRDALARLTEELGVGHAVELTGHIPNEEIEDYYSLIDVFVVPRMNDQAARLVTPLKPLEAMAMRVPVIASDLPALREIVEPGVRGLVCQPGDDLEIADAIATLMDDPSLRESLATAAYQWVTSERTINTNVARYKAALDSVLT